VIWIVCQNTNKDPSNRATFLGCVISHLDSRQVSLYWRPSVHSSTVCKYNLKSVWPQLFEV